MRQREKVEGVEGKRQPTETLTGQTGCQVAGSGALGELALCLLREVKPSCSRARVWSPPPLPFPVTPPVRSFPEIRPLQGSSSTLPPQE